MANIESYLNDILSARYGEEVRGSIANALKTMNSNLEDVNLGRDLVYLGDIISFDDYPEPTIVRTNTGSNIPFTDYNQLGNGYYGILFRDNGYTIKNAPPIPFPKEGASIGVVISYNYSGADTKQVFNVQEIFILDNYLNSKQDETVIKAKRFRNGYRAGQDTEWSNWKVEYSDKDFTYLGDIIYFGNETPTIYNRYDSTTIPFTDYNQLGNGYYGILFRDNGYTIKNAPPIASPGKTLTGQIFSYAYKKELRKFQRILVFDNYDIHQLTKPKLIKCTRWYNYDQNGWGNWIIEKDIQETPIYFNKVVNTYLLHPVIRGWGAATNNPDSNVQLTEDNKIIFKRQNTGNTGNSGIQLEFRNNTISSLRLKINIEKTNSPDTGLNIYIDEITDYALTNKLTFLETIRGVGEHELFIDLAYYQVYKNISSSDFRIVMANNPAGDVEITFTVESYFYLTNFNSGDNLVESLNGLNSRISKIEEEGVSIFFDSSASRIIVSPNGTKYFSLVDNDGQLITTPVFPNKLVVFGNSLTLGMGTFGMAASDSKHDYYHYLTSYLKIKNPKLKDSRYRIADFESSVTVSEAEGYISSLVLNNLSGDEDLIILQIGDNVNTDEKIQNFRSTASIILKKIREKSPKARVVWVGMWYGNEEKYSIIIKACSDMGCEFVSIRDLRKSDNESYVGAKIKLDDGSDYTVDNTGVASHPGDKGMMAIANRILYKLSMSDSEETYT